MESIEINEALKKIILDNEGSREDIYNDVISFLEKANEFYDVKVDMPDKPDYYLGIALHNITKKSKVEIVEAYKGIDYENHVLTLKFSDYVTHWRKLPDISKYNKQ